MVTPALPGALVRSRQHYLLELVAVLASIGVALAVMSPWDAVNAGALPKLVFLARMGALVLICTWFLRRDGERWADVGLRRPRRWWIVPLAVAGGLIAMFVAYGLVLPALGAPRYVSTRPSTRGDLLEYLYWALPASWGSAAFGEELVLRGFLLDRIGKVMGASRVPATLGAVVLQAAMFGAFHAHEGVGGVLLTGTAGVIFGLTWLASGRSLWPGILVHGLIDVFSQTEYYTGSAGA